MTSRFAGAGQQRLVMLVTGLGGLLYGIDIGVIDPALTYLNRSVSLSQQQLSFVVAAVLAGSILGSVMAGVLADWLGRKRMMIASGAMFIGSVAIIYLSQSYAALLTGRLLQGTSGGVIAVVVPLYLAECLPATQRGRGMALFQLALTVGIVLAAAVGAFHVDRAEQEIKLAGLDATLMAAAADRAWRGMFLAVAYPGMLFLAGCCLLCESPRWLVRRGRHHAATKALITLRGPLCYRQELDDINAALAHEHNRPAPSMLRGLTEILTERRYIRPFALACVILACSQSTGINSLLQFMSTILQSAGLDPVEAASFGTSIKIVNVVMTAIALVLVERKGRVFLLKLGTGGIVLSLALLSALFFRIEASQFDVRDEVAALAADGRIDIDLAQSALPASWRGTALQLTVLYRVDGRQQVTRAFMPDWASAGDTPAVRAVRRIRIERGQDGAAPEILRARLGPVPPYRTGVQAALCIAAFIACFAIGPGVCVWLALSELMPTRIRSVGMGVALLLNQGVATLIAAAFLPVSGSIGLFAMFAFWAACTVIYFLTVTFFLPETKGKTLEQIEQHFRAPAS